MLGNKRFITQEFIMKIYSKTKLNEFIINNDGEEDKNRYLLYN